MPALVVAGTRHPLDREAILGRHRDCTVRILDGAASRQHARVFSRDGQWFVEDLGSANGTKLDHQALTGRKPLVNGSVITIGEHEIRFECATPENPSGIVPPDTVVGKTIAGYRVDRLLGRGPTGAVYVARQLNLERDVAFKVVPAATAGQPGFTETFLKGMGKAASLTDDGFVRVHECGNDDGVLWYSMELVAGTNLDQMIAQSGSVDPDLAADTVARLAAALAAAHARGLHHHDLRPAVALITPQDRIKLCDVGLAAVFGRNRLVAGMPVSSAWYKAPEQVKGAALDARTDVYQLGAVLWHALTGQPPFQGVTAKEVAQAHLTEEPDADELEQVGRALRDVVLAMLAKDPAHRPQSMAEVMQRLDLARQGASTGRRDRAEIAHDNARRAQARAEVRETKARRRLVLGGTLAAVAIIAGAVTVKLVMQAQAAGPSPEQLAPVKAADPQPNRPDPVTPTTVETSTALDARWTAVQAQVDRNASRGEWGAAELSLRRFRAQPMNDATRRLVELTEARLAVDGADWFRQQSAALSPAGTPEQLAARLKGCVALRDRAPSGNRAQAEALYQETISLLAQRLQSARRKARLALENEQFAILPGIAASAAAAFTGTPLVDLHRRFAAECSEAARLSKGWQPRAAAAKGAEAVSVAAGYLILGVPAQAKAAMGRIGTDVAIFARRQALTGGTAILAKFDDPGDLAAIDTPLGDVSMQGGALTAAPGSPAAVAVALPPGDVDATLVLDLAASGAEPAAVISCNDWLVLDLIGDRPRLRLGQGLTTEQLIDGPVTGTIRIRRQAGNVVVYAGDRILGEGAVPNTAATLRLDLVGVRWKLNEIQVFGGP